MAEEQTQVVAYGLSADDIKQIRTILGEYPQVQRAVIFGSRAKGNFQRGSDVDIALFGERLSAVLWKIRSRLQEETLMPYFFDVLDYANLSNPDLREHIDRVGETIYGRG